MRFLPERWLGNSEHSSDIREASVPYSIGVRNCIGMRYVHMCSRVSGNANHTDTLNLQLREFADTHHFNSTAVEL
jgi:hypothetical protein